MSMLCFVQQKSPLYDEKLILNLEFSYVDSSGYFAI